ncbi:MAG TPA: VOC family protein [Polyangiaceae bacterium]|nr:VOC family protein [Polyangiaceae bacterium]
MGVHSYVTDLERSRRFYSDLLRFSEIGRSSPSLEREGRQRSLVFQAGEVVVACSTPVGSGGRAARYLARHPEGIGAIVFEVDDIRQAFSVLERRGATPITDIVTTGDENGTIETFSITTPFGGDTTFRFTERHGYRGLFPGMEVYGVPRGGNNELGFLEFDHITTNFLTMKPALLWLEHVLGFEPLWEVDFHTRDVARHGVAPGNALDGSGLRSKVMWDPKTRIKFANNEPRRPSFKRSQIHQFHEDNGGDGVQHIALATRNIIHAVRGLRTLGVPFQNTPKAYYELLPARLKEMGVERIDEDMKVLQDLEILVDGSGPNSYLLQIFLREAASLHGSREAGPFFFEAIERKGDRGFGAGNFRALFESIERQQATQIMSST